MTIDQKALLHGVVDSLTAVIHEYERLDVFPGAREIMSVQVSELTAYIAALPASDHAGLVERLAYRVNNPSAWDTFDQGGSDLIAEAATALSAASLAPLEGVTANDTLLIEALRGLVLLKDLFDASDRNQSDAYYILAKQDGAWGNARSALSAIVGSAK